MQHDGFSWQVKGERFEHLTELAEGGKIMDQTLRSFLRELTGPQRVQFVDTLFAILTCTDASTLTDLKEGGLKTASAMVKALQKLDKPTRKALTDTLKLLVKSGARSAFEELGISRLRDNRLIEAISGYLETHSRA
jgi:glutamate racemase